MRLTNRLLLKTRSKTQKTASMANRLLEEPHFAKAKEIFDAPEYPNKRAVDNWRFFVRAGKAATGPPIGQEFSKAGLKVMDFTKAFNDRTKPVFKDDVDLIVRIQVFFDRSYNYRIEPPPTAWFILKACRLKRRETGRVLQKQSWSALITLEMIYEIAKMKQFMWASPEMPMIESRVRSIVGQCRRMGIAVIGVDTPSSPMKGITPRQYEEQSQQYREEHMVEYNKRKQAELEAAPLVERLHTPNLHALSYEQLQRGLLDPKLFSALWKVSHPPRYNYLSEDSINRARQTLMASRWVKDGMTPAEARLMFRNWKLPAIEAEANQNANSGAEPGQMYWSRDDFSKQQK